MARVRTVRTVRNVRTVTRRFELYPRIYLTSEEKALEKPQVRGKTSVIVGENLSPGREKSQSGITSF